LEHRLYKAYDIYQQNQQGAKLIDRLVTWANENDAPTQAGVEMLVELQTFAEKLQGKDARAVKARLEKANFGSNPYHAALAAAPAAKEGRGGGYRGFRAFRGRGMFRGRGDGGPQQSIQCSFCSKFGHSERTCFAKNGIPGRYSAPTGAKQ
jgi:hypothetical protein